MAERTIEEALQAIAQLRGEVAHRAETAKAFAEIDRELTGHAEVHRELAGC